jgi:hypothetical protein
MKKFFLFVVFIVVVAAMGTPKNSSAGQDKAVAEIMEHSNARRAVRALLRDPESAVFATMVSRNGMICGYVNAKNGFGGYTGMKEFIYRNGRATINSGQDSFIKIWNTKCSG